ncbi:carbamoyltransferase [Halostella sp. JP-L12]|uniref:carbamoyltransferase family protein n=1 Tax=Halostella TaxID=1843185 RepID=UPI000EF7683C|nr:MULTISPECIES: carbamoyltransferase [Halostella]NHN46556.1 carbamoyltransferase [Halostella sp. JP-L12]
MYVLGISCYYHDAAACLLEDEDVVAAAAEERFSREKHDSSFPDQAVEYCLQEADIDIGDVDYVGFYEKPIEKFDRIVETFTAIAPRGLRSYLEGIPLWMRKRLWMRSDIKDRLDYDGEVLFGRHHQSHAASTFYASPFEEAAVLTVDGVGEWNTTTWGVGRDKEVEIRETIDFPHSLGLLYSAFTDFLGFEVNNGEYKVMGLASYGDPAYADEIRDELIDVKPDGSFRLNMDHFSYLRKPRMTDGAFTDLFGMPRRKPDDDLEDEHFDVAASVQTVLEEVIERLAETIHEQTDMDYLCMAGGVALNSVANGRILTEGPFEDTFIQPAAGDDGGAYGVAASIYHQALGEDRSVPSDSTARMNGTYLGPSFDRAAVETAVDDAGDTVSTERFEATDALHAATADRLADGQVVGIYQGRMEWGPRALGNRSILADPRDGDMQDVVNRKIKFREGFRPFAPTVLADHTNEYFDAPRESPYMLQVFDVHDEKRDVIPAVTHVDGTSRIQTIARSDNPTYYDAIDAFRERTGVPVVLNTSLNRRGEPIVCTPADAVDCFTGTEMDALCLPDADLLLTDGPEADDHHGADVAR